MAGCDEYHGLPGLRNVPLHESPQSMMEKINERIVHFIQKNKLLSLATTDGEAHYCCSIFYAFEEESGRLYFMSSPGTKHIQHAIKQSRVAGTIASANISIAKIQGIQFTGTFYQPAEGEFKLAKKIYLNQFPMARLMDGEVWGIEVDYINMTDNTLGFGKKIVWNRVGEEELVDGQ